MPISPDHKNRQVLVQLPHDVLELVEDELQTRGMTLARSSSTVNDVPIYGTRPLDDVETAVRSSLKRSHSAAPTPPTTGLTRNAELTRDYTLDELRDMPLTEGIAEDEHDWKRLWASPQKRCRKCFLWEVPYTVKSKCKQNYPMGLK